MNGTRQRAFPFTPPTPDRSADALIRTEANRAAVEALFEEPSAPGAVLLIAPRGGGKRHLARLWAERRGATIIDLAALGPAPEGPVAAVSADRHADATTFLTILKRAEHGAPTLIAGRGQPETWAKGVPDLATRLASARRIELPPPDDALARRLIAKHLADRGLDVAESALSYAINRAPRSYDGIADFAARIDALAMEQGPSKDVGLDLVRRALTEMFDAA